jgi:hypothetical protein
MLRVIKAYGYFKVGDIVSVVDLVADSVHQHKVLFFVTSIKGWTIPRECVEWV